MSILSRTLPLMYIGDDTKPKVQSGAMLRYAATLNPSANLYPSDKLWEIEEAIGLLADFSRVWQPCVVLAMRPQVFGYPEDFSKTPEGQEKIKDMRMNFIQSELPKWLKFFADMIDENGGGKFLCGDSPTIADCMVVPTFRGFTRGYIDHVPADCLDVEPRIVDYIKRFVALEKIQGRYTSGLH